MDYTHVSEEGAEQVLCEKFNETWRYFDVINQGRIDADQMPSFFSHLAGLKINLQ